MMTQASLPPRIRLRLAGAHGVLWAERLAQAAWRPASLLLALAGLALLLPVGRLPLWLHLLLLAASLSALGLFAWRERARLQAPRAADAERRLELDSGVAHRPFATLRDRPADAAESQREAWAAHRASAAAALASLRLRGPRSVIPAADPFGLRVAALLLAVCGLVVAGPRAGDRLAEAFLPGLEGLMGAPDIHVQAWIQPPAYTGLAPIFLPQAGGPVTAPAGSRLSVSLTGGRRTPRLHAPGVAQKFERLGEDSYQASAPLQQGGPLRITRLFGDVAAWTLTILPNDPPTAHWPQPPSAAPKGLATRLPWQASQRWGVASLEAELQPAGRPDLPKLHVRIPLAGAPKEGHGEIAPDLSANPYAGVHMTARLLAIDVSGQHGASDPADVTLPARAFHHPLARAIADLRRRLALHPSERDDAASDLSAMAAAPLGAKTSESPAGITLNLAAVAALLQVDRSQAGLDQAQARLWTIALALDGALPDASQRALAQASEDMNHALDERARGRIGNPELAKRLDALREALAKRLADIAKKAQEQGALQNFDPKTNHLSSGAMDRMIRKMEQAAQEGRMDDAKRQMAELEKMLDQLNNAKIMTPEQARQQQEAAKRGRQMMGAVQDMVHRETGLLDHAQARAPAPMPGLPPQFRNFDLQHQDTTTDGPDAQSDPGQTEPQSAPPQPRDAENSSGQDQDARTQRALRRALDAMKQALKQGGAEVPKNFDQAGQEMDTASGALADREDHQASDAVRRAIAALQQGGRDMAKQMSKQGGGQMQLSLQQGSKGSPDGDDGDEQSGEGQESRNQDPLGRRVDGHGQIGEDPTLQLPKGMEEGRSRAIQDELRRRGADRARPQEELDYIGRLLKPF
jgi:uncharacterized protein (TIGR02302 family)